MKPILLLFLALSLTFAVSAQRKKKWEKTVINVEPGQSSSVTIPVDMKNVDTTYIYEEDLIHEQPLFPGSHGLDSEIKLDSFIYKHLQYPIEIQSCECQKLSVSVNLDFDKKGNLVDISLWDSFDCVHDKCPNAEKACREETIRVCNLLPKKWDYKPRKLFNRGTYSLAWIVDFKKSQKAKGE